MTEKLLHFIWQSGYFNHQSLHTTTGEKIQVINRGSLNSNQGPDFSEARIRIGETLLAGSVELHIKTSDWDKHEHSVDSNYNNVILHVVFIHDRTLDHAIPVLELQPLISTVLFNRYETLMMAPGSIACGKEISSTDTLTWTAWIERVLIERLCRKSELIFTQLKETKGHWEEILWWMIARNFGVRINAEGFEAMAKSLPLAIISKHKHSIHQTEALLFGQCNLLGSSFSESYPRMLKKEYQFLRKKYGIRPAFAAVYFLRMRPANFPTIRLAQLAMIIHNSSRMFSAILEAESIQDLKKLLDVHPNDYWFYHYRFDELSAYKEKNLGKSMIENIIINTMAPLVFAYGLYHKHDALEQKALQWLEACGAEKNRVVAGFTDLAVTCSSAYDTQALVELKNRYCDEKRCLDCAVGSSILKRQQIPVVD